MTHETRSDHDRAAAAVPMSCATCMHYDGDSTCRLGVTLPSRSLVGWPRELNFWCSMHERDRSKA